MYMKGEIKLMQKGVKFRIYPNKEQQNLINQTFGCCRLVYNLGLDMRNKAFENGEKVNYSKTSAMLTELKRNDEFLFLRDVERLWRYNSRFEILIRALLTFFRNVQDTLGLRVSITTISLIEQ